MLHWTVLKTVSLININACVYNVEYKDAFVYQLNNILIHRIMRYPKYINIL